MASLEVVLGCAVMATLAWQLARVGSKPIVRRALRGSPARGAIALGVGLLGMGAAIGIATAPDPWRRAILSIVVLAMAGAAWRARPGYGRTRGLPPGSLSLGASLDALTDRDFYRGEAARNGAIFKSSQFGQPVVCIVGLERGRELLTRHGHHLEGATLPYSRLIPKGALRYMKPEDHRELAAVFRTAISSTDMKSGEETARAAFRSQLRRLASESQGAGVRVVEAIDPAVFAGLIRVLYGLESDQAQFEAIRRWIRELEFTQFGSTWRGEIRRGLDSVTRILRSSTPDESSTLGHLLAANPRALEDDTISGNLILILRLGYRDLTDFLVWVFKMLSDNPEWVRRMREEPPGAAAGLATRIVMETLRMEQSEYLYRRAAERFEFGGYTIPKGWLIRICVQESHRDPDIFEHPNHFDPDRFAARSFGPAEYSPLGIGAHGCMGPPVIHFLGAIFVEELTRGFDWQIVSDGPPERSSFRHWNHWRPNPRMRAVLTARDDSEGSPRPAGT